ncbi:MAG TPA: OsmC family protein [Ohtaekwangia sp.]|nr:OsmC family protein [Ohtaekwangia sp.]
MEPHQYNVTVIWNADRKGVICSPELNDPKLVNGCLEVATPPEFPKGIPGTWSPEHLYTAAVSSCLMTTFLAIAENSKLDFVSFRCESSGKLELVDGKYKMTEVVLNPNVEIVDAAQQEKALRVLSKAESNCLISNSITAKVSMNPVVEVAQFHN